MTAIEVAPLRGMRCPECQQTVFAQQARCRVCGSDGCEVVDLPTTGTVEAFTSTDGAYVVEVRLTESVLVLGRLEDTPARMGMAVRLIATEPSVFSGR